jgi:hypothetical protein
LGRNSSFQSLLYTIRFAFALILANNAIWK